METRDIDNKVWNQLAGPHPHSTVIGFGHDKHGGFPMVYRSKEVRSMKEMWSLPSGLHEIGRTLIEQFADELYEELGLKVIKPASTVVACYENITAAGWHWVNHIIVAPVKDLNYINKEPQKHTAVKICTHQDFLSPKFFTVPDWDPVFGAILPTHKETIFQAMIKNMDKPENFNYVD